VYVPQNRGLQYVREQGLRRLQERYTQRTVEIQEARGEDIPLIVQRRYNNDEPVFGITGGDLFDNFLFEERTKEPCSVKELHREKQRKDLYRERLNLRGSGFYQKAIFGLPALCILGKGGISLERFVDAYPQIRTQNYNQLRRSECCEPDFRGKKVVIPKRYEYLIRARTDLTEAEVICLEGKVDVTAARGGADYAVDIVLTGKTCCAENLGFFPPVLYLSEGIIIGNKRTQEKNKLKIGDYSFIGMGDDSFSH